MSNLSLPIRIPQDLRDTVTALHIDPAEMIQQYFDTFRFYPYFSTRSEQEKSGILSSVRHGFTEFQQSGNIYVDPILEEINQRYCKLLVKLSNDTKLSPPAHDQQSILLIDSWEKEARPLTNYPQELVLEGDGRLRLSFNFILCNICFGQKIKRLVSMYMKRISMVFLYAHAYPGNAFNNKMVMQFFESLVIDQGQAFLPRTTDQTALIEEYRSKLVDLFEEMTGVKNYQKRLKVFRPLIKEWTAKMEEIN